MSETLPVVYLARHGQTAWSRSGRHTGLSDLPLTERGEHEAMSLKPRLAGIVFSSVFTSPLRRAAKTCEIAGFGAMAETDPDLVEWNYGSYDGRTSAEIHAERPDWQLFRDGCPGGEQPADVSARADRVVARLRQLQGHTLLFSSGHFLRALAARWIGLDLYEIATHLLLDTASVSVISYEHTLSQPAIGLWNDTRHAENIL